MPNKFGMIAALALLLAARLSAQDARLAIVASPELAQESSLLTTDLSHDTRLKLLERAEIDKALAEQALQANGLTVKNSVRLGQLLKADALVLLEKTSAAVTLRVVAVKRGIVLGYFSTPLPINNLETWSKLRGGEVAQVVSKLGVGESGMISVSLLRINSTLGGAQNAAMEESCNTLMAMRLAVDPGLLVLERARLQDATAEKGDGAEAFANSSWLIDGSITRQNESYALDLRLRAPGTASSKLIKVQESNLGKLAEKANEAILNELRQPVSAWDASHEAERFVEEAKWAADNGLWEQAARAMEAAVALGENTPEALRWRWKCYDRLSRNAPGAKAAGGFSKDGERPSTAQILQMSRSVQLCREALAKPAAGGGKSRRFSSYPQTLNSGEVFGQGPVAEGSMLLRAAGGLIAAGEKKRPADGPEIAALKELRSAMHELYETIVQMSPDLTLKRRAQDQVPPWNDEWERIWRSQPGPRLLNIQIERLGSGRLWENEPGPYFAFVEKCLTSDLPATPNFFLVTLDILGQKAQTESLQSPKALGPEWREAGKALAAKSESSLKAGGAVILCRSGQPLEGIAVFAANQPAILSNQLPLDYLTEAFSSLGSVEMIMRQLTNGTIADATGAVRDLIVALLKKGYVPSANVLWKLHLYPFSDLQAPALREELKKIPPASIPPAGNWSKAAESLDRRLAERAGQPVTPPAAPTAALPIAPKQSPNLQMVQADASHPLNVDLGWAVKNYDDPEARGVIRWAIPQGNRIFLQIEYTVFNPSESRRVFRSVDLPSLQSEVIYRDAQPAATRGHQDEGPTFATDGKGVYFWNGTGLSYASGKKSRTLKTPELENPLLWLIEGKLYIADKAGVILRYDPANEGTEILASQRRRPAQSTLDSEPRVQNVRRIYRNAEGTLEADLGDGKIYAYDEPKHDWQQKPRVTGLQTPEQLLARMADAWDEAGPTGSQKGFDYLRQIGKEKVKAESSGQDRQTEARRESELFFNPAASYMGIKPTPERKGIPSIVNGEAAIFSAGIFWCLIQEEASEARRRWLLELDPATGAFFCRALDLSPEFAAANQQSRAPAGTSLGSPRLLPAPAGLCFYTPNESVLWFVPASDLPMSLP